MNKKILKQFMGLVFDTDNFRAKEILQKMRDMDEKEISFEDYTKKCLSELAKDKAETLFICFSVGKLYGEYQMQRRMNEN